MISKGPAEADQKLINGEGMMKKMLIVLFGMMLCQGYVFAETWKDRAAK